MEMSVRKSGFSSECLERYGNGEICQQQWAYNFFGQRLFFLCSAAVRLSVAFAQAYHSSMPLVHILLKRNKPTSYFLV